MDPESGITYPFRHTLAGGLTKNQNCQRNLICKIVYTFACTEHCIHISIHVFIMSPAEVVNYHTSTPPRYCYRPFPILLPLFFPTLFDVSMQGSRRALKLTITRAQLLHLIYKRKEF